MTDVSNQRAHQLSPPSYSTDVHTEIDASLPLNPHGSSPTNHVGVVLLGSGFWPVAFFGAFLLTPQALPVLERSHLLPLDFVPNRRAFAFSKHRLCSPVGARLSLYHCIASMIACWLAGQLSRGFARRDRPQQLTHHSLRIDQINYHCRCPICCQSCLSILFR
ncbi:hypothetical protein GGR54DRAFT_446058 [Hypoxylon sp. NC1633]|nr:hypothetical protein GGR54DRAFT_446058 [Hypoxylon sp. NC1633]